MEGTSASFSNPRTIPILESLMSTLGELMKTSRQSATRVGSKSASFATGAPAGQAPSSTSTGGLMQLSNLTLTSRTSDPADLETFCSFAFPYNLSFHRYRPAVTSMAKLKSGEPRIVCSELYIVTPPSPFEPSRSSREQYSLRCACTRETFGHRFNCWTSRPRLGRLGRDLDHLAKSAGPEIQAVFSQGRLHPGQAAIYNRE